MNWPSHCPTNFSQTCKSTSQQSSIVSSWVRTRCATSGTTLQLTTNSCWATRPRGNLGSETAPCHFGFPVGQAKGRSMHVVSFTSLARGEGGIVGHLLHALRHDGGRQAPRRRAHSKHVAISVAGTRVDAGMFDHGHLAKLRLGEQSNHWLEGRERQDSGFAVTTASPCCRTPPTWIICATPQG